jgi:hypothetical protein
VDGVVAVIAHCQEVFFHVVTPLTAIYDMMPVKVMSSTTPRDTASPTVSIEHLVEQVLILRYGKH